MRPAGTGLSVAGLPKNMADHTSKNKRALLITDNSAHVSHARSVLGRHNIIIATEYESLSSINVIRKSFKDTRNTVFIRKSFSRMVNDWGPPFLIILDYRIDLGPESIHDADHRKLLRTFFISLVIMMKRNELDKSLVNIILLTDKTDFAEALNFQKNPVTILDILMSDNEDINNLISGIKKDPGDFNKTFKIIALPDSSFENTFEKAILALTKTGDEAKPAEPQKLAAARTAQPVEKKDPADRPVAHIVLRIDDALAYVDGAQVSIKDRPSLRSLSTGQFYVLGRWEYWNQAEVAGILGEYVTNGIGGKRFHQNDEIIINLGDHCTIDATVIASLVNLFTKQLSVYNKKSIVVSYNNADILEKGSGYILIKKYVRHTY